MDECSVNLQPYITSGWALKGSRPVVKTNFSRHRFHIIGARTRHRFVFRFITRQTQRTFIRFLKALLKKYPRLVIFIDNAPWHRGKAIKQFLAQHRKTLRIYHFPPYSPELNPVEQHWKLTKQALSNRILKTIPAAQYHAKKILTRKEYMPRMFQYMTYSPT